MGDNMEIKGIKIEIINTDIAIVGGGAAGCQAAIKAKELDENLDVLIIEKAHIERSGCLAAGVNAINAYLNPGQTPENYVEYVKKESSGLIREDLTYTIGKKLNHMTNLLEDYGLTFQKDEKGNYMARGKRSVKINGENIKPVIAKAVNNSGARVLNKANAIDYIMDGDRVAGVYAHSLKDDIFYVINAKAVICTTGGASGIYKANNPTTAAHKMWYCPFNTGAGLAMGLRAGAEMTTFEMRFIALRTKDTISPTGTIAQGVKSRQINALGEDYVKNYENGSTPYRLYATVMENLQGRGPCYLETKGLPKEDVENLKKAYLSMSPGIILKWAEEDTDPSKDHVELCGSEPYINGGHGQAGYWVSVDRESTVKGLYAAGDVVGGSPKKYVTGSMAEGDIAVNHAIDYIKNIENLKNIDKDEIEILLKPFNRDVNLSVDGLEDGMQKIMDEYAGGIGSNYMVNEEKLIIARKKIIALEKSLTDTGADNLYDFMKFYELKDRVLIAKVLIEHLLYRKETRWRCYQERIDYPGVDNENWLKFVNSTYDKISDQISIKEVLIDGYRLGDINGN